LKKSWAERWEKMNQSDRSNPRRLIRAIEIALAKLPLKAQNHYQPTKQIGLQLPLSVLREKIVERVDQRLEAGVMKEVQQFGLHHPDSNLQAKTALGYQEINQFLKGELALEELKTTWAISEFQYAKRQQTWWKKQVGIKWLHTK
jgi:tRNA dimethylallyltransferase